MFSSSLCLIVRSRQQKLIAPSKFPLCWAVPQPAIFYQLMAIDVLEYIKFLERVSPQVKSHNQPPGLPIQNDREASLAMDALKALQVQQWQHRYPQSYYPFNQFIPMALEHVRALKIVSNCIIITSVCKEQLLSMKKLRLENILGILQMIRGLVVNPTCPKLWTNLMKK
uniref:Mediator of RNA polymerase II transcription subunit 7 n=1 Tax=Caenorhabditis tropicalis TaxID=1561998 RepID=A0A1I7UXM2_9PELO